MMITTPHLPPPDIRSLKLTDRQREILDLIQQAIEMSGAPPTRAEIARTLGFKSANAAEEHLQALARKGVIDLVGGTSRGIRLNKGPLREHGLLRQQGLPLASLDQLCLPLIGKVAAGRPMLALEHVERHYTVESHLFAERPDYLLTVRGMSMRDAGIIDGDLLAVKRSTEARNGQIVVARIGDDVTVKRFRRRGDSVQLVPENPAFEVLTVADASSGELSLEGIVVGLIRDRF